MTPSSHVLNDDDCIVSLPTVAEQAEELVAQGEDEVLHDHPDALVIDLREDVEVDLHDSALVVEVDDDAVVIDLREPIEAPVCSARGKTALEWALALLATLLLLPVLLVLGAIISISSGGTFWYSQVRVGRGGQLFRCYKLRSMVKNADAALHDLLERDPEARAEFERDWKLSNDPRITTIGKILRKTSLDELPQLINVLKGEMALVGPRPVVPDELSRYGHHVSEVLSVRPGLTGLWQVSGRNDVSYAQRVQLDVAYVRERSVPLDVSIIARTALQCVVPSGNGAR